MVPDNPVTAALVILSTALTGLAGLLAAVVRSLIKGDLISRQVLADERSENRRLLTECKEATALERTRADLAESQLQELSREMAKTTVALLRSIDQRAAEAAEGRPDVVPAPPAP